MIDDLNIMKKNKPVILLVDDEVAILNATRGILRRTFKVHTFSNPLEVMGFLENNKVDVIVSDEMMPEMKGSILVEQVHEKFPDICKIILSGQSEKEDIANAVNGGHIFSFLFKPTDETQLFQVIEKGLENKKLREEINEKNNLLEKHNKNLEDLVEVRTTQILSMEKFFEVGKFSASIVHNLNNPLQSLIMAHQLLEHELRDHIIEGGKAARFFTMMDENLIRLEDMIKSITSSVRSGTHEKDIEIDINKVIKSTIEFLKMNSDFKYNVEVKTKFDIDNPTILGQVTHFSQIFSNLIKNSIDAMEKLEKGYLYISTLSENGKLIIEIKDNGHGIKPEDFEKIFSTEFTTKDPGKGTGLGLPITKQMIESYKGTISMESIVGKGTTFTIIFSNNK